MNELIKKISILFIIISLIGFGSAMHFDLEERFEDPMANRIIFMDAGQIIEENSPKDALVTGSGPYPQPMLIDQIRYLASMIDQADQRPGKDAYDRFQELTSKLEKLSK